ncbi:MAG: hypothetical protein WCX17_03800 [Parcubacteria group bacterium]|jgi:hypothetical protein
MWNPFKKSGSNNSNNDDTQKMGMLQSLAMKKAMKMSPQERNKMMEDMTKPENKDKLLSAMKMMRKTGMLNDEQMEEAKKRLGL